MKFLSSRSPLFAGITWLTAGTITTRVVSLVAQLVLAALLSKEDFGIYAIVVSIVAITNSVADAGVDSLLVQRGAERFDAAAPTAFWTAFSFNAVIAVVLAIASPLLASIYGDARIPGMLLLIGLAYILQAAPSVLKAKLSVDLQFNQSAGLMVFSSVVKYLLIIGLAWTGFGPYSFILPLPIIALLEGLWLYRTTRQKPWAYGFHITEAFGIIRAASWIIIGQAATALLQSGDYLVLGLLLPVGTVGVYYFAYELVAQVGALFAQNVYKVLFPILVQAQGTPTQWQKHTLNGLRLILVAASLLSISIAVAIEPLAAVTGWDTRFPGIVQIVRALAFFFPLRMLLIVIRSNMMARGHFRKLAGLIALQGIGLVLTVAISVALLNDGVEQISLVIGVYLGGSTLIFLLYTLTGIDFTKWQLLKVVLRSWLIGAGAGLIAIAVSKMLTFRVSDSTVTASAVSLFISLFLFLGAFVVMLALLPEYRSWLARLRPFVDRLGYHAKL